MQQTPSDTFFRLFHHRVGVCTPVAVHLQRPEILRTIYVQYHVLFIRTQKIAGIFTFDGVLSDCSAVFVTPGFGYSVCHLVQDVVLLLFFHQVSCSGQLVIDGCQERAAQMWLAGPNQCC